MVACEEQDKEKLEEYYVSIIEDISEIVADEWESENVIDYVTKYAPIEVGDNYSIFSKDMRNEFIKMFYVKSSIKYKSEKDNIYYYPDCETMTDVAYYYIDELQALGDIPPSLQNYIDYEAYGRDLDMGGCFIETSRGMCEIPY